VLLAGQGTALAAEGEVDGKSDEQPEGKAIHVNSGSPIITSLTFIVYRYTL
jgi:hypothetical protein